MSSLKRALDRLYLEFNQAKSATDPIQLVRPYTDPADREVVAFCTSALAFGRVGSILQSVGRLLDVMGPKPARFVRTFDPANVAPDFRTLGHRWARGGDLMALLWVQRVMIETAGSLEGFFGLGAPADADDVGPALESFTARASAIPLDAIRDHVGPDPSVRFFFPRPSRGSACKRLNLFLRWMVRSDAIDLGLWSNVRPAQLVIPLDTHVVRVGQCLGLTRYRTPGWRMAAEITAGLRRLDPLDPVRYDFAMCHLGMMNACGFKRPQRDAQCPLRGACRPGARTQRASRPPSVRR